MSLRLGHFTLLIVTAICFSCKDRNLEDYYEWIPLEVTATAYNSVPNQTSYKHPLITAWGDSIKPGVKWIAVSRDLLRKGLVYNTMVKVDTFSGIYLVKDKMNDRWTNRIDIYMGEDLNAAKEWGKQKVTILYAVKNDTIKLSKQ